MSDVKKRVEGKEVSLIKALQDYITKIVATPGMKALLLDEETTAMVGLVYSQSDIIAKEVFLVERIDRDTKDQKQSMQHLKAVVLVRPVPSSIEHLRAALKTPKFKEYHLFFTNYLGDENIKILAEADEYELIRQVQEFYADFYAVDPEVYTAQTLRTRSLYQPQSFWLNHEKKVMDRNLGACIASFLAMKQCTPVIRYSKSSEVCKLIGTEILRRAKEDPELFMMQKGEPPLLLLLDRRDDPVTPLLMQWTYQAMVHELIGIKDNRVDLKSVPGIRQDLQEVVLSSHQDKFFKNSMFLTYGDLGASVKELVQTYSAKAKINSKLDSIEDMQRFVDQYPEFRHLQGNVSKHVALMGELSRLVERRHLLDVSELEQEIACNSEHSPVLEGVGRILDDAKYQFEDKLRLVALYALRYENNKDQIGAFKRTLLERASSDDERRRVNFIDEVLKYAGSQVRGGDLFSNKTVFAQLRGKMKAAVKGVENVFTQHRPLLFEILDNVAKSKLKPATYPWIDQPVKTKFKTVFVYILGGITYEEAATVHAINENPEMGLKVLIGGSAVHHSRSFISDVLDSEGHAPSGAADSAELEDDLRIDRSERKKREAKRS